MSIVLEHEKGWIIDHGKFISQIYSNLKMTNEMPCAFEPSCFSIHFPFYMNSQLDKYIRSDEGQLKSARQVIEAVRLADQLKSKKRKRNSSEAVDNSSDHDQRIQSLIRPLSEEMIALGCGKGIFREPSAEVECVKNPEAKKVAQKIRILSDQFNKLFNDAAVDEKSIFSTLEKRTDFKTTRWKCVEYTGNDPCIVDIEKQDFVLPPNCRFINSDIEDFSELITLTNETYDFIVIDPPWINKSVKRKRGYKFLNNDDIKNLPIKELANDGAVIAVWVTNKSQHIEFIEEELFPAWNVKKCAMWHWLKVCTSGDVICEWDTRSKKPYEHLYIGQKMGPSDFTLLNIANSKLLISVPSAILSHKPPLIELFREHIKTDGNYLELFARSLLPNWTSWGNQVLLLQHLDLYRQCCDTIL